MQKTQHRASKVWRQGDTEVGGPQGNLILMMELKSDYYFNYIFFPCTDKRPNRHQPNLENIPTMYQKDET